MTITPPDGPPPRRSSALKRLLIIGAVVLVVCCGGAAAASFGIYRWYNSAAGPAQDTTDSFLGDLERGDTAKAYSMLCPSMRARLSERSFGNYVAAQSKLRSHKIVATSVSNVNGRQGALVTVDLVREGGGPDRHVVQLQREDGTWYVCGEPF
jgi:hypothetical protein